MLLGTSRPLLLVVGVDFTMGLKVGVGEAFALSNELRLMLLGMIRAISPLGRRLGTNCTPFTWIPPRPFMAAAALLLLFRSESRGKGEAEACWCCCCWPK